MRSSIARFYGSTEADRRETPYFGRIVDEEHFDRLVDLVERSTAMGAILEIGGQWDRASRYVGPTVLSGVTGDMPVMQEEIFAALDRLASPSVRTSLHAIAQLQSISFARFRVAEPS